MRGLLLLVLAAIVACAAWIGLQLLQDRRGSAPALPEGAADSPQQPLREALAAPNDVAADAEWRTSAVVVENAPEAPAAEPACVVLGCVLDEEGAPIPGAVVRLGAYKVWKEGLETARLPGRVDIRGFEAATDGAGAFRIEAPPPSAPHVMLWIAADRFHDSHRVSFGDQGRDQAPLTAGVRDLGEIRLATTGAIHGRVTDAQGRPVADAQIKVGPERSQTFSRDVWTEQDGTYTLGHAPVGTYGVGVRREGFLSQFRAPVTVSARADLAGMDFALAVAPTIEGFVVDESGRPLEGARLWAWPSTSGHGAGATSGADGRFTIHLPQDEPYTLGVQLDGHAPWGNDRATLHDPGTRDLRVVLRALQPTRIVVVDAATGEPVRRFGLAILEENGSASPRRTFTERRPPRQEERPDGSAEATAREGIDLYVIAADGYLLASGDVAHDVPGLPVQTVRLRRGLSVRGRVLRDGEVQPEVAVELVQVHFRHSFVDGKLVRDEASFSVEPATRRSTRTDGEGRFELAALELGDWRLKVQPAEGAALVVVPLRLSGPGPLGLGYLHLLEGAALDGRVLVPAGVSPAGLVVTLDAPEGPSAVCDRAGAFRFEDVPAGTHRLALRGRPGELDSSAPVEIELAPGETRAVTIDARDRAMCAVALLVDLDGLITEGRRIELVPADGSEQVLKLGACDAAGRVHGWVRALGEVLVRVRLEGGHVAVHPDVRLRLLPLGRVEAAVTYRLGALTLRLPPWIALPENGHARLRLERAGNPRSSTEASFVFREGALAGQPELLEAAAGELRVRGVVPGGYTTTLELFDASAKPELLSTGTGVRFTQPEPYFRAGGSVSIGPGAATPLDLR